MPGELPTVRPVTRVPSLSPPASLPASPHRRLRRAAAAALEPLEPRQLFAAVPFTPRDITITAEKAHGVFVTEFRGGTGSLGGPAVIAASQADDTVEVHFANGGAFDTTVTLSTTADEVGAVSAVDLDSDGDNDVLSAAEFGHVTWYENSGNNAFAPGKNITTSAVGADAVAAADMDGDGDVDVVSNQVQNDLLVWYENDGDENFTARTIQSGVGVVKSVFLADFDGANGVDVLSGSTTGSVRLHLNAGGGAFAAPRTVGTADDVRSVVAEDLDADGDLDVLSASVGDDTVAWYRNDGDENFAKE